MSLALTDEVSDATVGGALVCQVYGTLRREILTGLLRPNQPLVEAEIADRLGVSRMPVRESLQRLALDGLVSSQRRRWIVHEHTSEEIREIYEVRAGLESRAAELACERATEAQRAAILEAGSSALSARAVSLGDRVHINSAFHKSIAIAAGNARLRQTMVRNSVFYFNRHVATFYRQADLLKSAAQHEELALAIMSRDSERSAKIAKEHVMDALKIMINHIRL